THVLSYICGRLGKAYGSSSWLFAARFSLFAFRCFFRTLIKWRRHHLRFHALSADFDFYRGSNRCLLGWNVGERNVFLQERRRRTAGDIADLATAHFQNLVSVAGDSSIDHLEPDQRFLHALSFRLLQCRAPNKVRLLHLAET